MDDKTFAERLELAVEGSWWKRIDDDAIGTILEIRDDNSNNLIVRWTHPSFEGSRAGEYDRYEFVRKWVPLSSHPDDIPVKVDSIWKSNKTGDIVKVIIEPSGCDHCVHYINLNDTTGGLLTMSRVDRAVFITEYTFLRDNDNGALYRHNRNPNMYLKVIETTEKALMGAWMRFVKYRSIKGDSVEEDGCLIVTFHSCCHLLSLDPEKEWTVPTDSVRTIKAEEKEVPEIKYGSIWTDIETGKDVFKVSHMLPQNDKLFVHYVDIKTGIERAEPNEDFVTRFKLLMNNDLSAIYENRENPSEWVQVVICDSSTCVNYHYYGGKFNGREDENDITTFHKQYKLVTFYPTDADIENMKFHGISKKFHKIAEELKAVAKECDITVGSIWRGVKGMEEYNKGRLIKVVHINGSLISWRYLANTEGCPDIELNRYGTRTTCDSSFLYCFEKVQDNDNGAIYRPFDRTHNSEENPYKYQMVKVVETNTSTTPESSFVYGTIKYITVPVSSSVYSVNLEEFHYDFELFSMNPEKDFCVPTSEIPATLSANEEEKVMGNKEIKIGSLWISGPMTVIVTDVNDKMVYVTPYRLGRIDTKGIIISEFLKEFTEIQINDTKADTPKEETKEEIKNNSTDTYLKTDASKLEDFGTGAKREDKSGKGRYDLIPGDVMQDFEDYVEKAFTKSEGVIKSPTEIAVSSSAYFDGWMDKNNYYKFILNVTAWNFVRTPIDKDEMTYAEFHKGFYEMRKALAKHYEEGAKVHGVDNWKKGLPIYGSARGGCFLDSMRRHTDQMLQRKTDEPHAVAALWNAFCALWTLKHKPYSATYQNASAVKAEEKPKSAHFDMIDSAIDALKYMNEDKDHLSATKIITPSGKKFTIRKWPEGYEPVVDFEKEALMREMNLNYSSYNDIIKDLREVSEANRIEEYHKMILKYHDVKYNLLECIKVLRDIVTSKNFSRLDTRVTTVYFDIYSALVILHDIINWFHEDQKAIDHIAKIITDIHDMINMGVGHICSCYKIKKLEWETCPEHLRGFALVLGDPNEDKVNILYETIGRAVNGLLNRNEKGLDPFCGLGITQSLAKFNTDCIKSRVYKK